MKKETIHQSLKLPGTYRITVAVDGNTKDGTYYQLRRMNSQTLGHKTVYGLRQTGFNHWEEINVQTFRNLALEILRGVK